MLTIILVVLLVVLLCGGVFAGSPGWRGTHGPGLGGLLFVLLFIVLVFLVLQLAGVAV